METQEVWYQSLQQGRYPIAKCPKCGHNPDRGNLIDSLHPMGMGGNALWIFSCLEHEAGCGKAYAYGRTEREAVDRWNAQVLSLDGPEVVILHMLDNQLRDSIHFWATRAEDLAQKLKGQTAITESLKRDLATLQGRTVLPCPAAQKMGEHACQNQHNCWEPCGSLGNDSRFAIPFARQKDPSVIFRGIPVVNDVIPADPDPKNLAVRPVRRAEASVDNGNRRRKTD